MEFAFGRIGVFRVQPAGRDETEDRVAEKLEPFVRGAGAFARGAFVHEGLFDRRRIEIGRTTELQ